MRTSNLIIILVLALLAGSSCERFFDPPQELAITEDLLYDDWYEYRAVEMGLYGLQQNLVEQLVILGELRGDLLKTTSNSDADMIEIYNFNVSKNNRYASPVNFYKLISACNNFIRVLEREHPEVSSDTSDITNYDRLYGEALCMRAWTYFTAVRIYGRVPFIPESLVTMDEIEEYINTPGIYIDSVYILFDRDGYHNDTVYNKPDTLQRQLYSEDHVIRHFIDELETRVRAVGVDHAIENRDNTWEVTIWNTYAWHALLGHMYLTIGDLAQARYHFDAVIKNNTANRRYRLDDAFSYGNWANIFTSIDNREHIYTLWFDKTYFQQNRFQSIFEPDPHKFMLKPSGPAIFLWETLWRFQFFNYNPANPALTTMDFPGLPGDFYRGYGTSYIYINDALQVVDGNSWQEMLELKSKGDYRSANAIMEGMDTIVVKFSIGKDRYAQDANFAIYRAASIHLYQAEVFTWWVHLVNDIPRTETTFALGLINNGSYFDQSNTREEMGVRGRIGITRDEDRIHINNEQFIHDPFTNEIIGYRDMSGDFQGKQLLLEERILDERARELAFEGERFYDLMRVARRRSDPSFLAGKVSAKFPAGEREEIYNLLLDENNWYIHYFTE